MNRDILVAKANHLARSMKEWSNTTVNEDQLKLIPENTKAIYDFIKEYYTRILQIMPYLEKQLVEENLLALMESVRDTEKSRDMADFMNNFGELLKILQEDEFPETPEKRSRILNFAMSTVQMAGLFYTSHDDAERSKREMNGVMSLIGMMIKMFMAIEADNMPTDGSAPPKCCAEQSTVMGGIKSEKDVIGFFKRGGIVIS